VLSLASVRDLAVLCGYTTILAPLFPVTVDPNAARCASPGWVPLGCDSGGRL
jgi:hypothetical protein